MACRSSTRANETFFVEITDVSGADVGDSHGVGTITNDDVATPAFEVVISQIYGGGGNAGATLRHDYIELFNRGLDSGYNIENCTGDATQRTKATRSCCGPDVARDGSIR